MRFAACARSTIGERRGSVNAELVESGAHELVRPHSLCVGGSTLLPSPPHQADGTLAGSRLYWTADQNTTWHTSAPVTVSQSFRPDDRGAFVQTRGQSTPEVTYEGERVVVTGGASFIGSHLVELLIHAGARVTVADDLSSGDLDNLGSVAGDVTTTVGDLRDPEFASSVVRGQDTVFHLAAMHGGRGYIDTHPVECTNNMLLDHVVFSAAATAGVGRLVHASSACVYPVNLQASDSCRLLLREEDAGFDEPGRAFADGEYGWAKLMGELQLRAFHQQYGLDAVAARIFTAYGERENESHAVVALIAKAAARLDPYPVWGDGRQTRNFTYVGDTVMGLALAGRMSGYQVLNVGSAQHHTILELIDVIFERLDWRPDALDLQLGKPVGVRSRASDNTRIKQLTGWEPRTALTEGVFRTLDWYVQSTTSERLRDLESRLMTR